MAITFRFRLSYLGEFTFDVFDGAERYQVAIRRNPPDSYHLSICNGDAVRRDLLACTGMLHRCSGSAPISAATVAAFNAWKSAEHAAFLEHIGGANAEKYSCIGPSDPLRAAPAPAVGGEYISGHGWRAIAGDIARAA